MGTALEKLRLRQYWQEIKTQGLPPREDDPFCGDRYSSPVLAGNEITGQVALMAFIYDYQCGGWMWFNMDEGPDADEYETQHVTHWKLWPVLKLVCMG